MDSQSVRPRCRNLRNAARADGRRSAARRSRCLRIEVLERKELLAAAATESLALDFEVVAKAQPDEWYNGIGQPYVPLGEQEPGAEGQPKVNQDYVWGMTQSRDYVWFSSGGNVLAQATTSNSLGGGVETPVRVDEGPDSQFPLLPDYMRSFVGDWRPPEIHRYNIETGVYEDMTPDDPRIDKTLGLRSAGANRQIVLFAGPSVNFVTMNVFAFSARTGRYLGSETLTEYSDIRRWENVNGQLYTSALKTFSPVGAGVVLRWTGSVLDPFSFEVVGELDLEGAYITEHEGRLFVSTWPLRPASLMGALGFRSETLAGLWMSPRLGLGGLDASDADRWHKVWQVDQYEPDPVLARSYGGGALASFDGYLYWGLMQVPGAGYLMWSEAYPDVDVPDAEVPDVLLLTTRTAPVFRGTDFHRPLRTEVELLYGDSYVYAFTPPGADPETEPGYFSPVPNNTGTPTFGTAGLNNPGNLYIWSMAVHEDHLYVGTFDGYTVIGDHVEYIAFDGDVQAIHEYHEQNGRPNRWMGGDLWAFPRDNAQPFPVSLTGAGNPLNHGIRNMESTSAGLFLGSANSSNLLTEPYDPPTNPLKAGGWELIQVVEQAFAVDAAVATSVAEEQPGSALAAPVLSAEAVDESFREDDVRTDDSTGNTVAQAARDRRFGVDRVAAGRTRSAGGPRHGKLIERHFTENTNLEAPLDVPMRPAERWMSAKSSRGPRGRRS